MKRFLYEDLRYTLVRQLQYARGVTQVQPESFG